MKNSHAVMKNSHAVMKNSQRLFLAAAPGSSMGFIALPPHRVSACSSGRWGGEALYETLEFPQLATSYKAERTVFSCR